MVLLPISKQPHPNQRSAIPKNLKNPNGYGNVNIKITESYDYNDFRSYENMTPLHISKQRNSKQLLIKPKTQTDLKNSETTKYQPINITGQLLDYNILNQYIKKIYIIVSSYVLNEGLAFKNLFESLSITNEIIILDNHDLPSNILDDVANNNDTLIFAIGVINIKNADVLIPINDKCLIYQVEQQNILRFKNTDHSMGLFLKNFNNVIEFSLLNNYYNKQPEIIMPLINYTSNIVNKDFDILFYGSESPRRKKILRYLYSLNKYKIHIAADIWGEELKNLINRSKIILNLHFIEDSNFETFRINLALSCNTHIISERPTNEKEAYVYNIYENLINFVPSLSINENLNNLSFFIDNILRTDSTKSPDKIEKIEYINNQTKTVVLNNLFKTRFNETLFHKYFLKIAKVSNEINYSVIQNYSLHEFKERKYYAHLHCYDISKFNEIYKPYIDKISEYFSVIVTYSIGKNIINRTERFVILQIPNKGMDIGAKFCAIAFLNKENIQYEYVLFLHSKSNPETRRKYFEPLINNLDEEFIENINQNDAYFPDIQWEIVGDRLKWVSNNSEFKNHENTNWPERNLLYRNELLKYLGVNNHTNRFIEGNCYILSKQVIHKLYTDPLLYNILNTETSFDYNWVSKAYNIQGNIYQVYKLFQKNKLAPRNQNSFGGCVEDVFERVILNFCNNYRILNNELITKITNKNDFRKLCKLNLSLINNIIIPDIEFNKPNETFYIEFREFKHCEFIIRNIIIKLPDWSHTIVCGNLNYEFMKKIADSISPNIKIVKLDIDNLNTAEYSRLLMSKEFWDNFNGEKLLLYQEDSYMFHNRIDEFLEYDYIGAPWPIDQDEHINQKEYGVGNGGFSLRSKSKMIEVIEKINWEKDLILGENLKQYMIHTDNYIIPEDVYFSKSLLEKNIGKVAPRNIALKFSQETQKSPKPLGGHNFYLADNYTSLNYNKLYLNNDKYYSKVNHRGGWKSIIQYGLNYNIITDNFLEFPNIILEDCCESNFCWNDNSHSINNKWIGITHFTNNVPKIWENCHIDNILNNNNFIRSLGNCAGIIVLSNYMKEYLSKFIIFKNIPIYSLKHPIDQIINKFDINKFLNFNKFNIVLLGQQLRNYSDIFKINSSIINKKIWLSGIKNKENSEHKLCTDLFYNKIISNLKEFSEIKKTLQTPYLSNFEEYDKIITSSIILIPLYNASANNSVLEIIQTNTPAFITRLPSTEEYLGKNYPMFYTNINEVNNILNDRELFNKKYIECHNYLKNMDKSDLTYQRFYSDLLKIINDVY